MHGRFSKSISHSIGCSVLSPPSYKVYNSELMTLVIHTLHSTATLLMCCCYRRMQQTNNCFSYSSISHIYTYKRARVPGPVGHNSCPAPWGCHPLGPLLGRPHPSRRPPKSDQKTDVVWGSFWVPLGSLVGSLLQPIGRPKRPRRPQDRPKRPQGGLLNDQGEYLSLKNGFCENVFKKKQKKINVLDSLSQTKLVPGWLQARPRGPKISQDGPKTAPRRSSRLLFAFVKLDFDITSFWDRFGLDLGSLLPPQMPPFGHPFRVQNRSKNRSQSGLFNKSLQDRPKTAQDPPKTPLGPSRTPQHSLGPSPNSPPDPPRTLPDPPENASQEPPNLSWTVQKVRLCPIALL